MPKYKPLEATLFHKPVSVWDEDVHYRAGDVAMIPHPERGALAARGLQLDKSILTTKPIDQIFKPYHHTSDAEQVFIQMSDGIGDYFFFSAVVAWLERERDVEVTMYVDRNVWPVMEWFETIPHLRHFSDPILHNYRPFTKHKPERLAFEYAGVQGRDRLWIQCLFDKIGITEAPVEYLRPRLRTTRLNDTPPMLRTESVLICHRASSPSRSSRFEDFYLPLMKCNPINKVYVHDIDCTPQDKAYIATLDNVTILPKVTIERYLLNVFDAGFVISTDSSALHFREGVHRPALGVYASMEARSRVLHYQYTRSIDIKGGCHHQPCYFHQWLHTDMCPAWEWRPNDTKTAICQTGAAFQEQLEYAIWNY